MEGGCCLGPRGDGRCSTSTMPSVRPAEKKGAVLFYHPPPTAGAAFGMDEMIDINIIHLCTQEQRYTIAFGGWGCTSASVCIIRGLGPLNMQKWSARVLRPHVLLPHTHTHIHTRPGVRRGRTKELIRSSFNLARTHDRANSSKAARQKDWQIRAA